MARPAPAIDRAMKVLLYLAAHPEESFSLSELARRLDLNKATCHAMFAAMEEHGVMVRNPYSKTYRLGPKLLHLAEAVAPEKAQALDAARGEMELLVDDVNLPCYISGLLVDDSVVLARRLPTRDVGAGPVHTLGHRHPWAPPIGPVFAAWSAPDETQRWLDRVDPDHEPGRDFYERQLGEIRRRSYDLGLRSDPRTQLLQMRSALEEADTERARSMVNQLLASVPEPFDRTSSSSDPALAQHVFNITAPVFGPTGNVVVAMTIDGFRGALTPKDIKIAADRLLESTERATRTIHGRLPSDWPGRLRNAS